MKNSNSFSIPFWTNKAKADTNGYVPLYARVTVQGKRVEIFKKENKSETLGCRERIYER